MRQQLLEDAVNNAKAELEVMHRHLIIDRVKITNQINHIIDTLNSPFADTPSRTEVTK